MPEETINVLEHITSRLTKLETEVTELKQENATLKQKLATTTQPATADITHANHRVTAGPVRTDG